jgi:putative ABC transport system ATP-binding protein
MVRDQIAFSARGLCSERAGRLVLADLEFTIPAGRITVLVGPSGEGKTSLLRILNRLDEPSRGEILYRGRTLVDWPVRELRRRVGFVFQTPVMFAGSVADNLRAAARIAGVLNADFAAGEEMAMKRAQIEPSLLDRPGDELSVGQQQRVNLARALMTAPETLLLDEPTSALDSETAVRLLNTVRDLSRDERLTVVFATHRLEEARQIADSILVLRNGELREADPGALTRSSADSPPASGSSASAPDA